MENDRLILVLLQTQNEAADDVLLEGLRLGSDDEKPILLAALLKRKTVRGLMGVIGLYASLPEAMQKTVLANIRDLHPAIRESGRSEDHKQRMAAMRLIALGRQGKLAYVLSDNMYSQDEDLAKSAVEAIVALARWVSTETRWLQRGDYSFDEKVPDAANPAAELDQTIVHRDAMATYRELMAQRPEIESAVARAIDLSRGRNGPELLRASLLLCDWPGSKTLAVLQTAKHGGQTAMVRRLQQPPASEHVDAFLLAASHGQLRTHFGTVFAHISEVPVLDALLRKSHWLKDSQLQLCMHQVTRGAWWGESELLEDISRRDSEQSAKIGDWLVASGAHDVVQDDRMERLRERASGSFTARLHLLRLASQRRKGTSVALIKGFLSDPDERLARLAAREMIRRRPPEFQNILLAPMATAKPSVRRVISRSLGHAGFEQFWDRFDQLDRATRSNAGRALLKILPDSAERLARRLNTGPVEQRLKALQMAQDLGLVDSLRDSLAALTEHPNPKIRSKAVNVLADTADAGGEALLRRVLNDTDPRVRANAIAVLERTQKVQFIPMLAEKARAGQHRERANSIKALHGLKVDAAGDALMQMLNDPRPDHRVSALWALRQMGFWNLLTEVGKLAKQDNNLRVRRYALSVLKSVATLMQREKGQAG